MKLINPERYHKLVKEAQLAHFSGWDFSWLDGRMIQGDLPWNYKDLVKEAVKEVHNLLDMGTGGGEFLASLAPLPPDTHATESYPPNQRIAENRLTPLGVKLHKVIEGNPLPFAGEYFDLVINRHDSFDPVELHRILKLAGVFITQQVGGLDNLELNQILQKEVAFPFVSWSLAKALTGLYDAGFSVQIAEKAAVPSTFLDIGAVVYYLRAIPWQVEGFDPETHADGLITIHNIIEGEGKFVTTAHRFIIVAKRKAPTR